MKWEGMEDFWGFWKIIKNINLYFNNYNTLMVKLSLKGAQDPVDSSLQMKVRL